MIIIENIDEIIKKNKLQGPVTSPQFYIGNSMSFHPQGLYSEEIFGIDGSVDRKKAFSWIELNCTVIHPVIYDILKKRIFRKITELVSGKTKFKIDELGYLVEDENGDIDGLTSFYSNIDKIKWREGEDEEGDRNKIINMLYKNVKKKTFFMDKLLVVSPDVRPITVLEETGEQHVDPMSNIYRKIIMASYQTKGVSGVLYDILSYNIQNILVEYHELIKDRITKKSGLLRNLLLGRRTDFSARGIISPDPTLTLGYVGLPLRMIIQIAEPYIIYGILNSSYSKTIPEDFHIKAKEFLGKETLIDI